MKFYGRALEVAHQIVAAFEAGRIPEALATVYIQRDDDKPMNGWSVLNQLAVLVVGCSDARGYRQWQAVGRNVIKGESAQAAILVPLLGKKDDADEEQTALYGFRGIPVFDIAQTEGEPLPGQAAQAQFVAELPLIAVAGAWDIYVDTYNGDPDRARGQYVSGGGRDRILLGVTNTDTWLHELIHAADDRCGTLTETGQHWRSETVAQLGACTLTQLIGRADVADDGKTYRYIEQYADRSGRSVAGACIEVIERTAGAIELILATAAAVTNGEAVAGAEGESHV